MNRDEWVDVKALVGLEYDGRAYQAGDWLKLRPVDALTMGEAGHVSLNREYRTRASVASTSAAKPSKRTYKRRDLVAE